MFKPHHGICCECKQPRIIVVKKGYCKLCNERSKGKSTTNGFKQRKPIKSNKKAPTGERALAIEIWSERKHVCQCCDAPLGDEPAPHFFSHILSKGAYKVYRLLKLNIMLMCFDCHHEWDFGDKSQDKFKLARMIAEKLKRMYYGNKDTDDLIPGDDSSGAEIIPQGEL